MKVLIVYAHPEPKSFNAALRDAAVTALTGAGHEVRVTDLYAMQFNPVVAPDQFPSRLDPEHFNLQREQRQAAETGTTAPDVAAEHAKLFWADLVIFQFPLWWGSMPAIMKGWIDRVFSVGTIYGRNTTGLTGRKALLSITASAYDTYEEGAAHVTNEIAHIIHNMLALARLESLEPHYIFGASSMTSEERAARLKAYQERLLAIVQ